MTHTSTRRLSPGLSTRFSPRTCSKLHERSLPFFFFLPPPPSCQIRISENARLGALFFFLSRQFVLLSCIRGSPPQSRWHKPFFSLFKRKHRRRQHIATRTAFLSLVSRAWVHLLSRDIHMKKEYDREDLSPSFSSPSFCLAKGTDTGRALATVPLCRHAGIGD